MLKTNNEKNVKNNGAYNTFHEQTYQEWIDGRYRSPALICQANHSNEYNITLIQSCIEIISQHPIR